MNKPSLDKALKPHLPVVVKNQKPGLIDKIREAKTINEINSLLSKGEQYTNAHPSTKRRWIRVAQQRRKEIA